MTTARVALSCAHGSRHPGARRIARLSRRGLRTAPGSAVLGRSELARGDRRTEVHERHERHARSRDRDRARHAVALDAGILAAGPGDALARDGRAIGVAAGQRVPDARALRRASRSARSARDRARRRARAGDVGLRRSESTIDLADRRARPAARARSPSWSRRLQRVYAGSVGLEFMHISSPQRRSWLAERMETSDHRAAADRRCARACSQLLDQRRAVRAVLPHEVSRHEALLARRQREPDPAARSRARPQRRGSARSRPCSAWRTAAGSTRSSQHHAAAAARDLRRVRGHRAREGARRRRREVSPRLLDRRDRPATATRCTSRSRSTRATSRPSIRWSSAACARSRRATATSSIAACSASSSTATPRSRAGPGGRDAAAVGARRLSHRRHGPRHRQQPDRLHHVARRAALDAATAPTWRRCSRCPIFHVNGEDPDARRAGRRSWRWSTARSSSSDVVIDMYCYRKYGHNESDEPALHAAAHVRADRATKPSPVEVYAQRLVGRAASSPPTRSTR